MKRALALFVLLTSAYMSGTTFTASLKAVDGSVPDSYLLVEGAGCKATGAPSPYITRAGGMISIHPVKLTPDNLGAVSATLTDSSTVYCGTGSGTFYYRVSVYLKAPGEKAYRLVGANDYDITGTTFTLDENAIPKTGTPLTPASSNATAIQGIPVSTVHPTNGQSQVYNSVTNKYEPSTVAGGGGGGASDATPSSKGIVRLAGDLAGTADNPTVPGLSGKANTAHTHPATDVVSGTLSPSRIPFPAATTIGGVQSRSCGGTDKVSGIGTDGVPVCTPDQNTGSAPDATSSTKGVLQLTGDIGGTAASPTVPGLSSKSNVGHTHAESEVTSLVSDLAAKAADSAVVHNTGTENIGGLKTFTSSTSFGGNVTGVQASNNSTVFNMRRNTDTSPTGSFIQFRNNINNADLFRVAIDGSVTTAGGVTVAGALSVAGTPQANGTPGTLPTPTAGDAQFGIDSDGLFKVKPVMVSRRRPHKMSFTRIQTARLASTSMA
jgi:hypothetical protein